MLQEMGAEYMINCPKCSSEALVETPALGAIPLDVCPGCSGILFDKGELEALLKQAEGGGAADLALINPKADGLVCPRCKNAMSHGGLVNPLLLVDKCQSCGGVWLDSNELGLVKKLLGLSGGASEVKVDRPAAAPEEAPPAPGVKAVLLKLATSAAVTLGLIGISYEIYLYLSPADAVAHAPSVAVSAVSVLLCVSGVFYMDRKK